MILQGLTFNVQSAAWWSFSKNLCREEPWLASAAGECKKSVPQFAEKDLVCKEQELGRLAREQHP